MIAEKIRLEMLDSIAIKDLHRLFGFVFFGRGIQCMLMPLEDLLDCIMNIGYCF
jgi:hypothetical protein